MAPVTLASRADEAEDRRSKFYEISDNLRPANAEFWAATRTRVQEQAPVLLLERIARGAGAREWYVVLSVDEVDRARQAVHYGSCITAYFAPDLPLHGPLTQALSASARDLLRGLEPDDVLVGLVATSTPPRMDFEYIESEDELDEFTDERRGQDVWIGRYPDWPDDSETAVTVFVADADGVMRGHPY